MTEHVAVTGADGFIGSHLTEALVREGYRVRALAQYNSFGSWGWLDTVPDDVRDQIEVVSGDVRDAGSMRSFLTDIDVVCHLAALIAIPYSYLAPASYLDTNAGGTLNVLEAARALGVGRVIHTSTSEVYGTARTVPISEEHPLQAQSPYSASKVAADKLAESYHLSFGLPVVTVRPFNTYGPRQSARAVIPTILSQLLAGRPELRLGATDPQRDLTFVTDTAAGLMAVGGSDAAVGRAVNLGTGRAVSVGELAERCMAVVGRRVPVVADAVRVRPAASEVMALVSDNRLAGDVSGWRPVVSLEDGLRRCAEFVAAHPHLYNPEEYQR